MLEEEEKDEEQKESEEATKGKATVRKVGTEATGERRRATLMKRKMRRRMTCGTGDWGVGPQVWVAPLLHSACDCLGHLTVNLFRYMYFIINKNLIIHALKVSTEHFRQKLLRQALRSWLPLPQRPPLLAGIPRRDTRLCLGVGC